MSSVPMIVRRNAVVAMQRAAPQLCSMSLKALGSQVNRFMILGGQRNFAMLASNFNDDNKDKNDYEGHKFEEFLDEMLMKADKIEESVDDLIATHLQKRRALKADAGTASPRMQMLFDKSAVQNDEISKQIASLKAKMEEARRVFAVDAPDGTPDYELKRGLKEVKQIIDFAAENEDIDKVIHAHQEARFDKARAKKIFAVDAPDGSPDDLLKKEIREVDQFVNYAAEHEDIDQVIREHQKARDDQKVARKIFAVEAPDGSPDDVWKQEVKVVNEFVDYAAEHEDIDKVLREHQKARNDQKLARKVFAVEAPDGTPDDEIKRGRKEVDQIIDFAAEHEDIDEVLREHQKARKGQAEVRKTFAIDAPDGSSDFELLKGRKEIDQIIEFAAEHEDIAMIRKKHELEEAEREAERKIFAVDAPDGSSDYEVARGKQEVGQIIDFAAEHEDIDEVIREHQKARKGQAEVRKTFAVDAPDGSSDFELMKGQKEIEEIIEFAAEHEDTDMIRRKHELEEAEREAERKIFAVDAPDGSSDFEVAKGSKDVEDIIEFAAEHKDMWQDRVKDAAELEAERKIYAVDAPDGSSDYEIFKGRSEVDQIIQFAAEHEDFDKVIRLHELEQAVRKERVRDPERDW